MRLPLKHKSLTLIELLIAVILLSVVVLAFSNIQIFSNFQVLTGDRRAKVQNEAARVIAHMSKEIPLAIGNEVINNPETVVDTRDITGGSETKRIKVYIDADSSGKREDPGDCWITYRFYDSSGNNKNQLQFCGKCQQKNCNTCVSLDGWETISSNITDFSTTLTSASTPLQQNFIEVTVTTCWNPDAGQGDPLCGDRENPSVTLTSRIQMPSVSTH